MQHLQQRLTVAVKHLSHMLSVGMVVAFVVVGILAQLVWWSVVPRWQYLTSQFSATAGRTWWSVASEGVVGAWSGWHEGDSEYRWLVLGTDEVRGSGRTDVLTDTIMIVSYQPADKTVRLLSLPRDLYFPDISIKINSLYHEGRERNPVQPEALVQQELSSRLGLDLDGVVVLRLEDVEALINLVGGVELDVPHGFRDEQFPRSGVDVSKERDPRVLYETVEFVAGPQKMDGATALKYMRSRKSHDVGEGSDAARQRRQQEVIAALARRVQDPLIFANPRFLGSLYRWYADRFSGSFSLFTAGEVGAQLVKGRQFPVLQSVVFPVPENQPNGISELVVHPDEAKYRQWVYELRDPSGEQLRAWVKEQKL